jgi:hypothetical protein
MEEALHDMAVYRWFAGLDSGASRLPDESTILRFRHFLEEFGLTKIILAEVNAILQSKGLLLKSGTAIDATLISAPGSTKNDGGSRDPEMHQTKKGNQYHFGMYYGLDHGQHIGFYRVQTLEWIARRYNKNLISDGRNYHLFSDKKNSALYWRSACKLAIRMPAIFTMGMRSRVWSDFEKMSKKVQHVFEIEKHGAFDL